MNMKIVPFLLALFSLLVACDDDKPNVKFEPTTSIVAQQYLMDAKDLDLELTLGHLKEGEDINDPEALEKWINTTPGVNNVDLDKDGTIDLISVREQEGQDTNTSVLALTANPASGESTVVSELQFTHKSGEVEVNAGYPEYVQGHEHHHYHMPYSPWHSPLLSMWLWRPHPLYYHPMGYYHSAAWFHPSPVLGHSQLSTTRTTTHKTVKASPVKKATSGSNFTTKSKGATQTAAKRSTASATSIKSSANSSQKFTARDTTAPKPKATNLKPSAPAPKAAPRPPPRPAPRPAPRPSRPSRR